MPANTRENRITSIRRWEQAFRVYATIYCAANPLRSKEIWQYIAVINTAAASFIWDNVYNYDITFRHLMAFNPNRSWAVTYNQMWNLSMKDPINKNNGNNHKQNFGHFAGGPGNNKHDSQNSHQGKKQRSIYCWAFNKGIKCKFGKGCRFVERCSYCDSPAHGVYACPKLDKKNSDAGNSEKRRSSGGGNNPSSQGGASVIN